MSVLQRINGGSSSSSSSSTTSSSQLIEVPLNDAVRKYLIVSSRKVSEDERAILDIHGSVVDYDANLYGKMSIEEIFNQMQCMVIIVRIDDHSQKAYIQSHFAEIKDHRNFGVICLKNAFEDYKNTPWIAEMIDIGGKVFKTLEVLHDAVKDDEFFRLIQQWQHVDAGVGCFRYALESIKSLFFS